MNRTPSAQPVGRRDQPARNQVLAFVFFGLALTGAVLLFSTLFYGQVTGEEFSPDNFTRRRFSYYQVPFIGIQVSPIFRQDGTNALESFLTSEKLVTEIKTTDASRRWDLVMATRGGTSTTRLVFSQGEARILCSYLDAQDTSQKNVWLEWSKQHQELAKVIWPAVAKLARQELYVFVPELLLAARGASDAVALQQRMDVMLADKYLELARIQQQLGRHEPAVELFTEAIALSPQLAAAYAGRSSSLTSLGEKDRASADLAQAQRIDTRR